MAKNKTPIPGKYISPNTIEIRPASRQQLVPGQKVLVYRITNKNIVGSSGKIIGQKERVLGSGKIKVEDGKLLVAVPRKSLVSPTYKVNSRSLRKALLNQSQKRERSIKRAQRLTEVFIKPIEE